MNWVTFKSLQTPLNLLSSITPRLSTPMSMISSWATNMDGLTVSNPFSFTPFQSTYTEATHTRESESQSKSQYMPTTSIYELTHQYMTLLMQNKCKMTTKLYSRSLMNMLKKNVDNSGKLQGQSYSGKKSMKGYVNQYYKSVSSMRATRYDILLQYKIPFTRLGVEKVLVYAKLQNSNCDQYVAIWMKRNLYYRQTWEIDNVYIHQDQQHIALDIESSYDFYNQFHMLNGQIISDSMLSALFFTRLFHNPHDLISRTLNPVSSKKCHADVTDTLEIQLTHLFSTLYQRNNTHILNLFDHDLRAKIMEFREQVSFFQTSGDDDLSPRQNFQILSLYQVPSASKTFTRILVHLHCTHTNQYFSVWFIRRANHQLTWQIEDFYLHQFENIQQIARTDEEYCHQIFTTCKGRIFYTTDFMIEWLLHETQQDENQQNGNAFEPIIH